MITPAKGDLLASGAHILVCPCNTVGAPGAGLALQIAKHYPGHVGRYVAACRTKTLVTGKVLFTAMRKPGKGNQDIQYPIICWFPTKTDWRDLSKLEFIQTGLVDMATSLIELHARLKLTTHPPRILNIAMPALGCGLGGLAFADVQPLIEATFKDNPVVNILQYQPR